MLGNGDERPYRIREDQGILFLVLTNGSMIDTWAMKGILREMRDHDPVAASPVMVEQQELVRMTPEAKLLLVRVCRSIARPVAFIAYDLPDRIQGDFFARFHKPSFPFRVFDSPERALTWFASFPVSVQVR